MKAVSPSDFWALSPTEAAIFIEELTNKEEPQKEFFLTKKQRDHLETRRAKLRKKGINVL